MPLGIVIRKSPGVTRWAKWVWKAVAVLPGAAPANWLEMRREGEVVEYHAATLPLELWSSDTEAYLAGLSARIPTVAVVMRETTGGPEPIEPLLVTASPYEAQDYLDSGEEQVELVPIPHGLVAWIRDFVQAHHEDEIFVKRQRDRARVDRVEDGKGDVRIPQMSDVYRAPHKRRVS
ncbi:DUF3305 domain-containing protein [Maritimibacter sp. 55A14]|nr:DUF3305 domain-containing protein [Maritimibacter sp. 55A14]